jgi:hypothetical protein
MKQLGVEYTQSPSVTAMHDKSIDTRAFHNQSFSFGEIQRKQMQIGGKQKLVTHKDASWTLKTKD